MSLNGYADVARKYDVNVKSLNDGTCMNRVYVISSRFIYPRSQEKLCFGKYSGVAFVLSELGIQMSTLYRFRDLNANWLSYVILLKRQTNLDFNHPRR